MLSQTIGLARPCLRTQSREKLFLTVPFPNSLVLAQVAVLLLQQRFGPVPRFLRYNYHRRWPPSVLSSPNCVICMNDVYASPATDYMLTPCDHLFHTECLQRWMEVKRACPTCRAALPASGDFPRTTNWPERQAV
jgi:hypothetical protein